MKKRILVVFLVVLISSALSCQKQDREAMAKPGEAPEADIVPIKALIAEWVRLYNAEDFQNVMSVFYAKNAIVMPPNAPACRTKEAILGMYLRMPS